MKNIKINPKIKTAIIYSLDHIFAYIIEIKEGDKSYYICSEGTEPKRFGNMDDVRHAIQDENVQEAYLALSKTSSESDMSTDHSNQEGNYEYDRIHIK